MDKTVIAKSFHLLESMIRWIGYIAAAALIALIFLVVYDALMRYLFQSGSIALQELEWHLFDVVIMLGIAYTLQRASHVRVDIFYDRYSDRMRYIVNIIGSLFFILPFSLLIIYVGFDFVLISFEQMEASSDPGGLPYRYIVKSLMPLSFLLLIIQTINEIYKELKLLRGLK
jgi:TRAP-type mannitol/chloroaromatic compound transport system permease small subunit